jgi:hypothetical protein
MIERCFRRNGIEFAAGSCVSSSAERSARVRTSIKVAGMGCVTARFGMSHDCVSGSAFELESQPRSLARSMAWEFCGLEVLWLATTSSCWMAVPFRHATEYWG